MRLPLNADAQWILNVAERVLNGQRLYRDILEINPPLVIWLQLPIVWIARAAGVAASTVFRAAIVLVALGVTTAAFALFVRTAEGTRLPGRRWAAALVLLVLLILPGGAFGQREQLIAMLLLPLGLLAAVRAEQRAVGLPLALGTGIAAGIAIALKPYFIIVWLLLLVHRVLSGRTDRFRIRPEDIAVVGTGVVYVASVLLFAPGFISLARTYAATYAAYTTMSRSRILLETAAIIWFVIAVVAWRVRKSRPGDALGALLALAAVGAIAAAVWQGKGWTYHFLPAVCFSVLLGAVALTAAPGPAQTRMQSLSRSGAAAILVVSWVPLVISVAGQLRHVRQGSDAQAEVEARALQEAVYSERGAESILVLSSDMTGTLPWIGEARLVSRNSWSCLWVPAVVYHTRWNGNPQVTIRQPAQRPKAEAAAYASVVRDFTVHPPDLLVVESRAKNERFTGYPGGFDHLAYYGAEPRFAACLRQYHLDAEPAGFLVYRRTPADARAERCT